jgi:hypothetical protein
LSPSAFGRVIKQQSMLPPLIQNDKLRSALHNHSLSSQAAHFNAQSPIGGPFGA